MNHHLDHACSVAEQAAAEPSAFAAELTLADHVLALQRAAGNSAVSRLLGTAELARQPRGQSVRQRPHSRRQPAQNVWQAPTAQQQLIERLTAAESPLWEQLNPHGDSDFNCPATAAAVDHFLATGQVAPAEAGSATDDFEYRRGPLTPARSLADLFTHLARPGSHVTVHGMRDPQHATDLSTDHWFHLVNDRGTLVVVDVFGPSAVGGQATQRLWRGEQAVRDYVRLQELVRFEYYRGEFRVRRRPTIEESGVLPGGDVL
jgi:hypothetical protein